MKLVDVQRTLDEARQQCGVSEAQVQQRSEDPRLSPEVRARLKISTANALANIKVIRERMGDQRNGQIHARVIDIMNSPEPTWTRLRKLYALLDELNSFNRENVACRRGCGHCCHTQVAMAPAEAEMLGMAIHRKPKDVARHNAPGHYDAQPYGYHTPCTFLKNNECSIYEHRPLACRKLVNADIDNLLCQLTAPPGPPVPYLDRTVFDVAYVAVCAVGSSFPKSADIREYFP